MDTEVLNEESKQSLPRVGIIGGGIAGSTIALALSHLDLQLELFEAGPSLVNGPPMCHLHAGGNLYREIDEQQCLALLRQSIDTLKLYPQAIDYRPTVIAIPVRDGAQINELLPRLRRLQAQYAQLVSDCASNKVLGEPDDYFTLVSRAQAQALAQQEPKLKPVNKLDWLIPVVKQLDFSKLTFPLLLVQEYGLSVFRLAACADLSLQQAENVQLHTSTRVSGVAKTANGWCLDFAANEAEPKRQLEVDYLINACGYRSGELDDLVGAKAQRLVEFKAAYISHWAQCQVPWPEVVFYGRRGTPHGMAQLTPYPDGYFQIHGMTKDITLFENGLVQSTNESAQPRLPGPLVDKLSSVGWPLEVAEQRSQKAIDFIAYFLPAFKQAQVAGKPLFGAQQIPGEDPDLRASDVSFSQQQYARCEIVKASSVIDAAQAIALQLSSSGLAEIELESVLAQDSPALDDLAKRLAKQRGYPAALAKRNCAAVES